MKNRWTKTAVFGLIAVLVMALGAAAVFAQDDTTPDDTPTRPVMPFGRDGYHDGFHDRFHGRSGCDGARGANDEALAEALGIPVEDIEAARQKMAADRLAQAVEDGLITKDEANTRLALQALQNYLDRGALMAQALGFTPEEFAATREDGSLRELLGDVDWTELQENMQTAVEEAIDQAVAENVITVEQAALVKEKLENGLGMRGEFDGGYHGFGGRRGRFHDFHGAPRGDLDGEAFAPFRTFRGAPAFDA
jgi:ribosomal protein S20